MQVTKHVSMEIYPGFETQGRFHQKSETEESVTLKKDLCPPKLKKKSFIVIGQGTQKGFFFIWIRQCIYNSFFFLYNFLTKCFPALKGSSRL